MSDLQKYIEKRKARDSEFAKDFDAGYEQFKIGVMSADTIEAHWRQVHNEDVRAVAESPAAYSSSSKA